MEPSNKIDFVPIPFDIFLRKDISPRAKLCLGRLILFAGENGEAFPSQSTLAKEIGVGISRINQILKELEKKKLIKRIPPKPGHGTTKYKIAFNVKGLGTTKNCSTTENYSTPLSCTTKNCSTTENCNEVLQKSGVDTTRHTPKNCSGVLQKSGDKNKREKKRENISVISDSNAYGKYKAISDSNAIEKNKENKNTPPYNPPPRGDMSQRQLSVPYQKIVELWNLIAGEYGLKTAKVLSAERKRHIAARWKELLRGEYSENGDKPKSQEEGLEWLRSYFAAIGQDPFHRGNNQRGWVANLDYAFRQKTFVRLVEQGREEYDPVKAAMRIYRQRYQRKEEVVDGEVV